MRPPVGRARPGWISHDHHRYVPVELSAGVGFERDCLGILRFLPETFDEEDLDPWVPWLRRRHREMMNHRRHLLETVERFEQEGLVEKTG